MQSIHGYTGALFICLLCGQPAFEESNEDYQERLCGLADDVTTGVVSGEEYARMMPDFVRRIYEHFIEQYDGVECPTFPEAGGVVALELDPVARKTLTESYPDLSRDGVRGIRR